MRKKTTAEQIADQFENCGIRFRNGAGQDLFDVCDHKATRHVMVGDSVRYIFADGSVLTVVGGGWDFGYPDCFCWQGEGEYCSARDGEDDGTDPLEDE